MLHVLTHQIKNISPTIATPVMGLGGLSIVWFNIENIINTKMYIGHVILVACSIYFLFIFFALLVKTLAWPKIVSKEMGQLDIFNYYTAVPISILVLSSGYYFVSIEIARWLWVVGTATQFIFTINAMKMWHSTVFKIEEYTPSWFLPVVGTMLIPVNGVKFGFTNISWLFFSVGCYYWILMSAIIFYRLIFVAQMPINKKPTVIMLAAPPAVGCMAYVSLNAGSIDNFSKILYFLGIFIIISFLVRIFEFRKITFSIAWWSYTFPVAANAISSLSMFAVNNSKIYFTIGLGCATITSLIVAVVLLKTACANFDKN